MYAVLFKDRSVAGNHIHTVQVDDGRGYDEHVEYLMALKLTKHKNMT